MIDHRLLLKNAQRGDQQAFASLMQPYEKQLYTTAYSMAGNPHDAEDIWQNAVLRAWRNLPRLRSPDALRLWLARILLNEAHTLLRKRARDPVPKDLLPEMQAIEQDQSIYLELESYLGCLTEHQREAIILRFWFDLPLKDMAALLRLPQSTVKARLYGAISALQTKLPKEGER